MANTSSTSERVDALLESVLPPPAVRQRLRLAAGLTQEEVAMALEVRLLQVGRWERGEAQPHTSTRAEYARLLNQLAERFPEAAELDDGTLTPASEGGSG